MNSWECLNIVCRIGVAAIVIVKLVCFYDHYKREERLGLGIAGGCALMTVPAVVEGPASPFGEWSTALFALGVMIYFAGRLRRQIHHARANAEQRRRALERKGQGL